MAYFAKINNGIVEQVISVNNSVIGEPDKTFPETETIGAGFIADVLGLSGIWKQTSYNKSFRGNYAGIGYYYDDAMDVFIPPKPYLSWIWSVELSCWISPVEPPDDGKKYYWDEETISWKEIPE